MTFNNSICLFYKRRSFLYTNRLNFVTHSLNSFSEFGGGGITTNKAQILVCQIETDETAVCALPFRFTVSGILFAALILLSSISVYDFLDGVKEKEALDEVSKLKVAADQLSMRGEGSEVALELSMPEGAAVDFGFLPGRRDKWPADANNYCIRIGGKNTFYSSDAFFSNPELNGPVSLGSGMHMLFLSTKIESKSGRLFVLISEKRIMEKI
jgi:hypothetical protein